MSDQLHQTALTVADLHQITDHMSSQIANLDDFFRPIKSHFCWERHCFDIPMCWAFRSVFDALDNIDTLAEDINAAKASIEAIDRIVPQIITQLNLTADDTEALRALLVKSYGSADLQAMQTDQTFNDSVNLGMDFDAARK